MTTTGRILEQARDDILMAMGGKLPSGEDMEGNPMYEDGTPEECRQFVSDVFDNINYQMNMLASRGRSLERIAKRHGVEFDLEEYERIQNWELRRLAGDYASLREVGEVMDEAICAIGKEVEQ